MKEVRRMKSYEMDFCTGSLWKKIGIFSIPLMFSNILQVLFNMADVAVVGKFAGPIALGAVGSTSILVTLFIGLLMGISSAVNTLTARYIGAKDIKSIKEIVHTGAIICVAIGMVIMLAGVVFTRDILSLMNTKDELIEGAIIYLKIYLIGMPAMSLYNFGNAVLSAAGDTKRPLYYLTIAGIVNVILNLVFVIVCHMGVMGVALATVIAQYSSAFMIIKAMICTKENYKLEIQELRMNADKMKSILKIGIPCAMQFAIFAVANLFVQTSVNSFSHVVVEGNSAATNADPLVYQMMDAFYVACTSFMGQNLGAKKKDRVIKTYFICMSYSFLIGLVLGGSVYIFRYPFLGLFTNDGMVIEAGVKRLSIMALSYCVSAFMDCTIAASRGLGKTMIPTIIVILGSCVFRIFWIYTVFEHFRTIESLYLLYVFSWIITSIAEIGYFIRIYRVEKFE